jgi:ATP-dependent NAD(P)H-hydrate dehydratase
MRQTPPANRSSSQDHSIADTDPKAISDNIIKEMLSRLHVLVIGPGLGRDPLMQDTVALVVKAAREKGIPLVLDADALQVVQKHPDLVRGYKGAILTPNVVEFGRLCKSLDLDVPDHPETKRVESLAKALGGVTIVQKGGKDFVSNGEVTLTVDLQGGKKRSGGQGDTLTGSIATFLGWRQAYHDGLWETSGEKLSEAETLGLAAFGGAAITRVRPLPPFSMFL